MHLYIDYTPFLHKYTHVQAQKTPFHIAKKARRATSPVKPLQGALTSTLINTRRGRLCTLCGVFARHQIQRNFIFCKILFTIVSNKHFLSILFKRQIIMII